VSGPTWGYTVVMLFTLLACGNFSGPSTELLGRWVGNCDVMLEGGTALSVIDLTLDAEADGGLTGFGDVSEYDTLTGTATLLESDGDVDIQITDGSETYTILGTWDGADQITGACGDGEYLSGYVLLSR